MKNFALTGVAGYIAPRHLKAIRETGNRLVAATDPHDSVGVLDQYFRDVAFFTEIERFDRHLEKLRRGSEDQHINYLSICSPNNLHDAHIRLALRIGADAICEKPIVLNPWNLEALQELETESGSKIWNVLQLRLHPDLMTLKEKIGMADRNNFEVHLRYVTARGPWYRYSWKGNDERSGGVVTNIGIHFFDLLIWLFGEVRSQSVNLYRSDKAAGVLHLERADVRWFLSIDASDLPFESRPGEKSTYRSITVDGSEIEFTDGFTDLHTRIYEQILKGRGFGLREAVPSVELAHSIRNAKVAEDTWWKSEQ